MNRLGQPVPEAQAAFGSEWQSKPDKQNQPECVEPPCRKPAASRELNQRNDGDGYNRVCRRPDYPIEYVNELRKRFSMTAPFGWLFSAPLFASFFLQDRFKSGYVFVGKFLVFNKRGKHRYGGAVENPLNERLRVYLDTLVFLEQRIIEVSSTLVVQNLEAEDFFCDQAVQQGLYGSRRPVGFARQPVDDLIRRQRRIAPQNPAYQPFRNVKMSKACNIKGLPVMLLNHQHAQLGFMVAVKIHDKFFSLLPLIRYEYE